MKVLSRTASDVVLGVFAVAVISGAVVAMQRSASPTSALAVLTAEPGAAPSRPVVTPSKTPAPAPSVTGPVSVAGAVVLAGSDLAQVHRELAVLTGRSVEVVAAAAVEVLAPGALDTVTGTPKVVVLEVLAGSNTTVRATTAITAVRQKWPGVQVVVVGPFSSSDRKSAAAVKSAADAARATFLDPVLLKWRTADSSPSLTAADLRIVTEKLAAVLA